MDIKIVLFLNEISDIIECSTSGSLIQPTLLPNQPNQPTLWIKTFHQSLLPEYRETEFWNHSTLIYSTEKFKNVIVDQTDIRVNIHGSHPTRDLIIIINNDNGNVCVLKTFKLLDDHSRIIRFEYPASMLQETLPFEFFQKTLEGTSIYYVPFCNEPKNFVQPTTSINLSRCIPYFKISFDQSFSGSIDIYQTFSNYLNIDHPSASLSWSS